MQLHCLTAVLVVIALSGTSHATPVVGKLELPPPPERPAVTTRGFVDRIENPNKPVRPVDVGAYMFVALVPDGDVKPATGQQVVWNLVGESFERAVIGVPVGAELVIKNFSKSARNLSAAEDPKLIPEGTLNAGGMKQVKIHDAKLYTVGEKDTPHLRGRIVGVATPYVAHVDVAGNVGKFDLSDVPDGSYKLRVFYRDGWIAEESVNVVAPKAKNKPAELSMKVAAFTAKK